MKLHWLHPDCLNAAWIEPATGPSAFVFDEQQLQAEQWSLKRIGFVYECLLEIPAVEIWRGPLVKTLTKLVQDNLYESIVTVRTPDPWLQSQASALGVSGIRVEWIAPEPFVALSGRVDLGRFSRYWRKAEPLLLS